MVGRLKTRQLTTRHQIAGVDIARLLFGFPAKCSQEVIATIDVLESFSVSFYLVILIIGDPISDRRML